MCERIVEERPYRWHRRTYIKGRFTGKYWSEKDKLKSKESSTGELYYNIHLYEGVVTDAETRLHDEGPFPDLLAVAFPGELPSPLGCTLALYGGSYKVQLHDVHFVEHGGDGPPIQLKRVQSEGDQTFGTLTGIVTGYISDVVEETQQVVSWTRCTPPSTPPATQAPAPALEGVRTSVKTGQVQHRGNYSREQYWFDNYKDTYWASWERKVPPAGGGDAGSGCFGPFWGLLGLALAAWLLLTIGWQVFVFLLALFGLFLLYSFGGRLVINLLRAGVGILTLIGLIGALRGCSDHRPVVRIPREERAEREHRGRESVLVTDFDTAPVDRVDDARPNDTDVPASDTLITHYRVWTDYDSNRYSGTIYIRKSEYAAAYSEKNSYQNQEEGFRSYDMMLRDLSVGDGRRLSGVYSMLDSVRRFYKPDSAAFAKIIVSMVQDIPYTLLLTSACRADQYDAAFIQEYLLNNEGACDGPVRFGLRSPAEFIATLKGDCDTRTLLLYTILRHYGYRVAVLSSDVHQHSILAIDLPLRGRAFNLGYHRMVLWETTTVVPPGVMPEAMSDRRDWHVSLFFDPKSNSH